MKGRLGFLDVSERFFARKLTLKNDNTQSNKISTKRTRCKLHHNHTQYIIHVTMFINTLPYRHRYVEKHKNEGNLDESTMISKMKVDY